MSLILAYKNFAANRNISHIGLGVAALNTAKTLRAAGYEADVHPVVNAADLRAAIDRTQPSHVVVSAPWIPTLDWYSLTRAYPSIEFAMTCHSNVGFLQADTNGVRLVREALEIQRASLNFHVAGNSRRFAEWVTATYHVPCSYLPNLYHLDSPVPPRRSAWHGGTLRIGAFGAIRPLKNFMSAAAAAIEMHARLRTNVELWLSSGRNEGGAGVMAAITAMTANLPGVELRTPGWQTWPQFRTTVRHMHLLLQPSYTESFNMVTADGVAEGVPSVVSQAIHWAPEHWKAHVDDVSEISRVGRALLNDCESSEDGFSALTAHNDSGLRAWRRFLL